MSQLRRKQWHWHFLEHASARIQCERRFRLFLFRVLTFYVQLFFRNDIYYCLLIRTTFESQKNWWLSKYGFLTVHLTQHHLETNESAFSMTRFIKVFYNKRINPRGPERISIINLPSTLVWKKRFIFFKFHCMGPYEC